MTPVCPPPAFQYRAFISYSHRDRAWADWLHKALETYPIPPRLVGQVTAAGVIPRRLAPIFRDRDELASSTDLGRKVNEALAQSASLIVICSPRSASSRWVEAEVLAFKRLGRSDNVFCLIIDGEPNASDQPAQAHAECFTPALRFQLDASGQPTSIRTEPIAADARQGRDGKRNARLKLIAGMLDVSYDALKRRELQRHHRRLATTTALALLVAAVTGVLAIDAWIARHNAIVARESATAAQAAAERRQKQAEGLVGFMLGNLNDRLTEVGRLDIMQAVDDKAMAYYTSLPTTDVTDTALAGRAMAMEKIGYVRQAQGRLPDALDAFQAAARISTALVKAAPANTARQLQYVRTLAFIGQTHWAQGELDAAQASYAEAQAVLLRSAPQAAHDRTLQFELEMIDNDLGHVLEARGQLDQARVPYQAALELSRQLVAAAPDRTEWAVELGGAHNNLGKLALLHGDLATAITEYAADDTIESALAARDPANNNQRDAVLTVRAILGRTLALAGADAMGIDLLQQSVQDATVLVQINPHNSGYQDDLARYAAQLARLQRLAGKPAAARRLSAQSAAILTELVRRDSSNALLQGELAATQLEQAAESFAGNQVIAARAKIRAPLATLTRLSRQQPHDRGILLAGLEAKLLLAALSTNAATAAGLRRAVLTAAQSQASGKDDPRLLALQAEALLALARNDQAQQLIPRLWRSGYRDAELLAILRRRHIAYPVNAAFARRLPASKQPEQSARVGPDTSYRGNTGIRRHGDPT